MLVNLIMVKEVGVLENIAIISDIHGNIPALSSVLNDIRKRGISRIFCLGDLVGKGPCSKEAIDVIRQSCEVVVQGNWDYMMTKCIENENIKWYQNQLDSERINYLRDLPYSHDFYISGRLVRLFHASAKGIYHRVQDWSSFEERLSMFNNTELTTKGKRDVRPDVVGYGDVHNAYIQNFKRKTLFNAGSVGNPLDIPQASYAIIEGNYNSREFSSYSINFVRVPYDVELAIEQAKDSNMPELTAYIDELRTARYRGLNKEG